MPRLMLSLLISICGAAIGFVLGQNFAPTVTVTTDTARPDGQQFAGRDEALAEPQPAVARIAAIAPRAGIRPAGRETATLRQRIAELEAQLAVARARAEPRLAGDRLRKRKQLQQAVASQPLQHAAFYYDLADFIAVPTMIAEHPTEFAECLERFVVATGAHRAPPDDDAASTRSVTLEAGNKGQLSLSRFQKSKGNRSDSISVRLQLPDSLPLEHAPHLEYYFRGTFAADGMLERCTVGRENHPNGWIQLGLTRQADGRFSCTVPRAAQSLRRTPQQLEAMHRALNACALRLANLWS